MLKWPSAMMTPPKKNALARSPDPVGDPPAGDGVTYTSDVYAP